MEMASEEAAALVRSQKEAVLWAWRAHNEVRVPGKAAIWLIETKGVFVAGLFPIGPGCIFLSTLHTLLAGHDSIAAQIPHAA